jgi:ABC-type transporter lipoprotein component MlaA
MNPSRTSIVAFLALLLCLFSKPCTGRAETVSDPLQPLNRKIFWFNEKVDIYVLEPAARAYDHAVPDRIQTSVTNFFNNLYFLVNFTNSALQAKPVDAGRALVRFLLNTVGGMGGLFDPATSLGLPLKFEDVGQTLGYWGVPPGPYLVLPLLGPSNVRDAFGRAGKFSRQRPGRHRSSQKGGARLLCVRAQRLRPAPSGSHRRQHGRRGAARGPL